MTPPAVGDSDSCGLVALNRLHKSFGIFTVKQIVEKALEKNKKVYIEHHHDTHTNVWVSW